MTEFNKHTPDRAPKRRGLLRRLAGKGLKQTVETPSETPEVELTPDGVPKSSHTVTIIDPSGEKPPVRKTYRNW